MQTRKLGRFGPEVSALGYGAMGLSSVYGVARLEENLGAANVELTGADLRDIQEAASKIPIKGERLPEAALKLTNG